MTTKITEPKNDGPAGELWLRLIAHTEGITTCELYGHDFRLRELFSGGQLYCKKCGEIKELPRCSASGGMGFGAKGT